MKEGYCTSTALTDYCFRQTHGKLTVGVEFLDFSAAFDVVDHNLLLMTLSAHGFKNSAIKLLGSYLSNRKQCVSFNGSLLNTVTLTCGIPQGSCLGPLSVFVNDMPYVLRRAYMSVYADETTMYVSSSCWDQLNDMLHHELESVSEGVVENRLKRNASKTKLMVLGSKHSVRENQQVNISLNKLLEQLKEMKLLGVTLDQTMSWTTHLNYIVSR